MLKYLWIDTNKREWARCKTMNSYLNSRYTSSSALMRLLARKKKLNKKKLYLVLARWKLYIWENGCGWQKARWCWGGYCGCKYGHCFIPCFYLPRMHRKGWTVRHRSTQLYLVSITVLTLFPYSCKHAPLRRKVQSEVHDSSQTVLQK